MIWGIILYILGVIIVFRCWFITVRKIQDITWRDLFKIVVISMFSWFIIIIALLVYINEKLDKIIFLKKNEE